MVRFHLIVDGQQRLTSLYAITTGKPVVREDFTQSPIRIAFNPVTEQFAVPDVTTHRQADWLADITPLFEEFLDTVEAYVDRLEAARGFIQPQPGQLPRFTAVFGVSACGTPAGVHRAPG